MSTSTEGIALTKPATTETYDVSIVNANSDLIANLLFGGDKGADASSATALVVGDGSVFDVTGTTTITSIDAAKNYAGRVVLLQFDGALTFTNNTTTLKLPGNANITTAAGDLALMVSEGSDNWRCAVYTKYSGAAVKIADESVDSDAFVDGSIDAAHIASNAVTTAKINADAVTAAKIADDVIDSEHVVDGSIDTAHIADNQVTLGKLSDGTQGGIIYYGGSGAPTELAAGSSGYFLKTQGGSANPVWAAVTSISQANQAAIEGETNEDTYIPPDLIKHSPGVAKFFAKFNYSGTVQGTAYNTTSIADNGTGDLTVTIATDFSSVNWVAGYTTETAYTRSTNIENGGQAAGTLQIRTTDNNGTASDGNFAHVFGLGDQ
jgi:hypothetical protein|tara:strand:+ start:326 stop:1462 length:1137 start_codon:yes stop_codon:yes gene_type:complete